MNMARKKSKLLRNKAREGGGTCTPGYKVQGVLGRRALMPVSSTQREHAAENRMKYAYDRTPRRKYTLDFSGKYYPQEKTLALFLRVYGCGRVPRCERCADDVRDVGSLGAHILLQHDHERMKQPPRYVGEIFDKFCCYILVRS